MKPVKKGKVFLLPVGDRHLIAGEVTRVLKTGVHIQACGFLSWKAFGEACEPPEGTVALFERGAIKGMKFTDKRNRMRLIGIRDSRIAKTPKK